MHYFPRKHFHGAGIQGAANITDCLAACVVVARLDPANRFWPNIGLLGQLDLAETGRYAVNTEGMDTFRQTHFQ